MCVSVALCFCFAFACAAPCRKICAGTSCRVACEGIRQGRVHQDSPIVHDQWHSQVECTRIPRLCTTNGTAKSSAPGYPDCALPMARPSPCKHSINCRVSGALWKQHNTMICRCRSLSVAVVVLSLLLCCRCRSLSLSVAPKGSKGHRLNCPCYRKGHPQQTIAARCTRIPRLPKPFSLVCAPGYPDCTRPRIHRTGLVLLKPRDISMAVCKAGSFSSSMDMSSRKVMILLRLIGSLLAMTLHKATQPAHNKVGLPCSLQRGKSNIATPGILLFAEHKLVFGRTNGIALWISSAVHRPLALCHS